MRVAAAAIGLLLCYVAGRTLGWTTIWQALLFVASAGLAAYFVDLLRER